MHGGLGAGLVGIHGGFDAVDHIIVKGVLEVTRRVWLAVVSPDVGVITGEKEPGR